MTIANMLSLTQTLQNLGSTILAHLNTVLSFQITLADTVLQNLVLTDVFYAMFSIILTNQVATSTYVTMTTKTSGLHHGNLLVKI